MKGIYQYTDLGTGDVVYIGKDSYIDKNARHKQHLSPSLYESQPFNRVLQNNPERYGYSVLYCSDDVSDDDLNMLEISFIKRYNPRFNFTKGGDGMSGYNHTDEAKIRISEGNKGKTGYWKGRTMSEETRMKMSKNHRNFSGENNPFYGNHHSEETRIKISEAQNTSGYYRVYKQKDKMCKQGFKWNYRYYENGKQKAIVRVNLDDLEKAVKAKGLIWRCVN